MWRGEELEILLWICVFRVRETALAMLQDGQRRQVIKSVHEFEQEGSFWWGSEVISSVVMGQKMNFSSDKSE